MSFRRSPVNTSRRELCRHTHAIHAHMRLGAPILTSRNDQMVPGDSPFSLSPAPVSSLQTHNGDARCFMQNSLALISHHKLEKSCLGQRERERHSLSISLCLLLLHEPIDIIIHLHSSYLLAYVATRRRSNSLLLSMWFDTNH